MLQLGHVTTFAGGNSAAGVEGGCVDGGCAEGDSGEAAVVSIAGRVAVAGFVCGTGDVADVGPGRCRSSSSGSMLTGSNGSRS